MILINPSVTKPNEPPAGIAKLSGFLKSYGIKHTVLDANLEALIYIIDNTHIQLRTQNDKWTARALRNISDNYEYLKSIPAYENLDRYKRAVIDLNRAIESWSANGATCSIANFRDRHLSPLRSGDLIESAEKPEDNPYYSYFSKRLSELLDRRTSPVVGFSLNYLSQALSTFAMIGFLKKHYTGLSVVLGGGLTTSWMRNPEWHNPFSGLIDHLVEGPGEEKLLTIAGADKMNKTEYTPDYTSFPLNNYIAPGVITPYSTSSGCYWRKCSFCPEKAEGSPYIPIPVDTAIRDINELTAETKPRLLHIVDNAISESLLKKIALGAINVPWYGFARITKTLTDIDFCRGLKKSGCVMLKLGIESGEQRVLDKMNKGIDITMASLALKTLKKAGIAVYAYFIFGTPAETLTSARKTLEFIITHNDEINFINAAIFNMPLFSPEAQEYETASFYEGDLSLYTDFSNPNGWNRKDVRMFIENEFKKNKVVSGILQKEPPIFTSNHAPFFIM